MSAIKKKFNKVKEFIMDWTTYMVNEANEESQQDALTNMFNDVLYGRRKDEWSDF